MGTEAGGHHHDLRWCGIAGKLGFHVRCPKGGCALLTAVGSTLPTDPGGQCPLEVLAGDGNYIVLWTFDQLRRDLEAEAAASSGPNSHVGPTGE